MKFSELVAEEKPSFNKLINKLKVEQSSVELTLLKYDDSHLNARIKKNFKASDKYEKVVVKDLKPLTDPDLDLEHLYALGNLL